MNNQHYMQPFEFGPEEVFYKRSNPLLRYLTIAVFYLSFAASLAMFFLYWIMPIAIPAWLPARLIQIIEQNQLSLFLLPLVCLCLCYWALRSMTSDILACPEHYLDERQKMLRDQVHRSAYKFLKVVCFIIPAVILLCTISGAMFPSSPRSAQISPSSTHNTVSQIFATNSNLLPGRIDSALTGALIKDKNTYSKLAVSFPATSPVTYVILDKDGHIWFIEPADPTLPATSAGLGKADNSWFTKPASPSLPTTSFVGFNSIPGYSTLVFEVSSSQPAPTTATQPTSWEHDPTHISLFFGSFLLNIFLLISALPMALLAWKEKE